MALFYILFVNIPNNTEQASREDRSKVAIFMEGHNLFVRTRNGAIDLLWGKIEYWRR